MPPPPQQQDDTVKTIACVFPSFHFTHFRPLRLAPSTWSPPIRDNLQRHGSNRSRKVYRMYIPARPSITERAHPVSTPGPTWFEQFINLASKSNFAVSDGPKSCTSGVQCTEPFSVGQHCVVLIDTPGFDDSTLTEMEVLRLIATYLETSYVKLSLPPQKNSS